MHAGIDGLKVETYGKNDRVIVVISTLSSAHNILILWPKSVCDRAPVGGGHFYFPGRIQAFPNELGDTPMRVNRVGAG